MDGRLREATRLWTLAVPTVSAFVTSLVRDFQDRDDVLQETAVAVMESFDRYDSAQPFVGWAIGIARNHIRLLFRRRGRERVIFDSDAIDMLARAFEGAADGGDRLDLLADCVERLDPKARDLCRLRYDRDMKPAAIAQQLGVGANSIAKALQRIRDRLRDCVDGKAGSMEAAP